MPKYRELVGLKNTSFSQFWRPGNPKDLDLGDRPLPGLQTPDFSLCLHVEKGERALVFLFLEGH